MLWRKRYKSDLVSNSDAIVAVCGRIHQLRLLSRFRMRKMRRKTTRSGCGSGAPVPISFLQSTFNYRMLHVLFIALHVAQTRRALSLIDSADTTCVNWLFVITFLLKYIRIAHRDWKFEHPEHGHSTVVSPIPVKGDQSYSMRLARVGQRSLFSKEVLYSLVITNVLSILLGAGIG